MSLESDSQSPKMQRMLELQLSNYQVMISEIEQKVHCLLESCENIEDYQEQIDALSSKLEEVKLDLEGVQMMLEDTSLEEEVKQLSSASDTSISKEKDMSADMSDEEPRDERDLVTAGAADKQPGIIEGWELIQAQDLRTKFRMKQKLQQWQQLNSDLSDISAWLDKIEQELKELQEVKPPTSMKALGQTVKKLKDMLKAFDNYKTVLLSINLSSKEFQKADSTEFQNKLQKMNLRWEKETCALDDWREGLQEALLHCKAFHDQTQNLILWLAHAESRRNKAQITDPNADLSAVLECQRALMQLQKELMEQQLKVNSLEELTAYLLIKSNDEYIEAKELVHLIGRKLRHLIEQVSHDLKAIQGNLDTRECRLVPGDLGSRVYNPATTQPSPAVKKMRMKRTSVGRTSSSTRDESHLQPVQAVSRLPSFFCRVLRAALPFLMFILLLLLLACMVLFYVVAYRCTKANNFACSFHPMLHYTNWPLPF